MKICFLAHNLKQDNGGGVFALSLAMGLKKSLSCEVKILTTEKSGHSDEYPILHPGFLKLSREFFRIRKIIKSCDAVHALDVYPYGIIAHLASLGLGKKIIITAVGSGSVVPLYSCALSWLARRAYKKADKVVAISNFTKSEVLKKIPNLDIQVINPGVNTPQAPGLAKFGVETPYVLSVGSLRWRKGYKLSIKAFAKISKMFPELNYVIVGKKYTEKYYGELKQLISELGLEKKVKIIDSLDDETELAQIYHGAELFFLMSQSNMHDFEGFGIVFLEAASAGLPVIGSKNCGSEDAILDQKNGFLIDADNINGFVDAVAKILKDKGLRARMSAASLEFAKNSDWKNKIAEYTGIYKKLSKPKIVYVTNARLPTEKAHGLAAVKIAEAFGDLRWDVEILIPRRRNNLPADIFDFYKIRKNFHIKKLPTLDLFGWLPEKIAFAIQLFTFSKIAEIYSLFKYRRDTIFFSHDHVPLWFLSFFGKKIFYDIHHFPDDNFFYHRVLNRSFGLAVQTKWKVDELQKRFGVPQKKIVYWPNGTDVEKFQITKSKLQAREELGLQEDKKIVLYTGQLFDWKGVDTYIQTAADLQNIDFYVVGGSNEDIVRLSQAMPTAQVLQDLAQRDGASRAIRQQADMRVLAKLVAEAGVGDNLYFTGQRPHEEIPLWLRAADVLVLPNTGKQKVSLYYTSPMKMFEYMASGTPIVASRTPSITEILNEHNSILAEPDNPKSFAQKIDWVTSHAFEASKISAQAQKDVQKYTWLERAKKISQKFI